eukprot:TRINITY_DN157_c0_g1::TRINITY_DN157_c0_g1_i1::g.14408::m.14408 TRINITY_DN157_c0_g1::TRINITY_DN157_c0_g1_i1::g.14408  ORF type:complete len:187 (+),score=33.07 TRINITY_DN157_c0_g1_i1:268-828(+)
MNTSRYQMNPLLLKQATCEEVLFDGQLLLDEPTSPRSYTTQFSDATTIDVPQSQAEDEHFLFDEEELNDTPSGSRRSSPGLRPSYSSSEIDIAFQFDLEDEDEDEGFHSHSPSPFVSGHHVTYSAPVRGSAPMPISSASAPATPVASTWNGAYTYRNTFVPPHVLIQQKTDPVNIRPVKRDSRVGL